MRVRWLTDLLLPRMLAYAESRPPDFNVLRDGNSENIYLRRWWLWKRRKWWFNVYLHNMLLDDDSDLHDHPSWSVSLVLTDGIEEVYQEKPPNGRKRIRWFEPGDVVFRGLHFAHQLRIEKAAWTIFITGPKVRTWGFWCPRGWRKWTDYVHVNQDPSGAKGDGTITSGRGVGCGET